MLTSDVGEWSGEVLQLLLQFQMHVSTHEVEWQDHCTILSAERHLYAVAGLRTQRLCDTIMQKGPLTFTIGSSPGQ